jgi:hypothetical protein
MKDNYYLFYQILRHCVIKIPVAGRCYAYTVSSAIQFGCCNTLL